MWKSDPGGNCPPELGAGPGWQVFRFKEETIPMHAGRDLGLFTFAYLNPTADGCGNFHQRAKRA